MTDKYEFWFIPGSQKLYGSEQLSEVQNNCNVIVASLNEVLPFPVILKETILDADQYTEVIKKANFDDKVAGVITWMHTFSPAKNWLRGNQLLQKPLLHLATQFPSRIPYSNLDFDYLNINQSAHGDKEYGYVNAFLGLENKVIFGHWQSPDVREKIADWETAAVAYNESFKLKVCRFGDNMNRVAVTDTNRLMAQKKFGWIVDTFDKSILDIYMIKVTNAQIMSLIDRLSVEHDIHIEPDGYLVNGQLRQYLAIRNFMDKNGYSALTTNFQDEWGSGFPGLSIQLLMLDGYGFGAEGDWKTAALCRLMKIMSQNKGTAFIEDYTYDMQQGEILGAHMLEVDPSIASTTPRVEYHKLGIVSDNDIPRLVFAGSYGPGLYVSLTEIDNEFKLLTYNLRGIKHETAKLPIAAQFWQTDLNFDNLMTAWIENGGGHHGVISFQIKQEQIENLTSMFQIEGSAF